MKKPEDHSFKAQPVLLPEIPHHLPEAADLKMEVEPGQLISRIRHEISLYQKLLGCQEKRILQDLHGSSAENQEQILREQDLLEQIKTTEDSLKNLLKGRMLSEWISAATMPHRIVLEALVDQFRWLIKEINLVNLRNYRYFQNSIQAVQTSFPQSFPDAFHYNLNGHMEEGRVSGRRHLVL